MVTSVFLLGISDILKSINSTHKNPSFLFFYIWHVIILNRCNVLSTRKSYEFEDLLQSSTESCRVDWYAQSRLGLTRTLSEENVYEDIIGKQYISIHMTLLFFLNQVCMCRKSSSRRGFKVLHYQLCIVFA